ncbi:MAG: XRE family transcriptional regulator [Clostridia bacterium]|nr:XRE family transcriptional regulator [Clostridia bacterium]
MVKIKKDVAALLRELRNCPDFRTFYCENKDYMITESLSELLNRLMIEKGLKKATVIRASELSEVYGYQIFSGLRIPERKKLLCLAVGMRLNIDEVQTLLQSAGYSPLYVKIPFDSMVLFGICKGFSVMEINELLFEYGQEILG